uniref:J domain-containing protein n=1 Tax=Kalanchoe fedtschenkoi TaxID=63787 RepID=A0A7N0VNI5_KALFE
MSYYVHQMSYYIHQIRKLEEERGREREKDSLVFDRAIHEGLQKARSDVFPRVEKAAVDQGTAAHQQKAAVDSAKPQELKGESPQRCKARMERQRRMDERAAMALAEKNMRDLMAQREQAERNRLADSLGADVKRWAAGKEGNLRALLSTLQYILGPESGWKAIPLTDVITPIAVKKAYRKATLYVHPDKVQQRGASIQQKFICEKIFDLLKDAWNKFNSE